MHDAIDRRRAGDIFRTREWRAGKRVWTLQIENVIGIVFVAWALSPVTR